MNAMEQFLPALERKMSGSQCTVQGQTTEPFGFDVER